jgi:UTP--glucose-1-phosphate uridylyltransferase
MMETYEKYGGIVISGVRIPNKNDVSRYGIADIEPVGGEKNVFKIKSIVEKPKPEEAPSNLATHGAYILPPEIFPAIKSLKPSKGGEIWLVDAINILREQGIPVYACEIQNGKYYDTGNKLEYLKTVVEFALKNPEIKGDFREYLKNLKI